jgi:hypothetical protein
MKLKVFMSLVMVFVVSLFTTGIIYANSDDMLEKQQEIDKYIFEEHSAELAEKGITVTHTGPLENAVEIGITPYNEENANYFYEIFGTKHVQVVEGVQITTLANGSSTNEISSIVEKASNETSRNNSNLYLYTTIVLVIIGAGVIFAIRTRRANG